MSKFLFSLVLVSLLCGCGDDRPTRFSVSGKVVFEDGSYPKFGDIEFFQKELKLNAHGKIKRDGTFELGTFDVSDGAVEGNHNVVIVQRTRNHLTASIEGKINHDHGDLIDPKYYDYRSSDLEAKIEPVELNEIVLTVKKMKKRDSHDADH